MHDQTKCFILTLTGYEEITYAELTKRRNHNPTYHKKRFIPLHGMLMEVSEEDYKDFYRKRRRQKYLDEEAVRVGAFSYNALDSDDQSGEDILVDDKPPPEEIVTDKLLIETLKYGMDKAGCFRTHVIYCAHKTKKEVPKCLKSHRFSKKHLPTSRQSAQRPTAG